MQEQGGERGETREGGANEQARGERKREVEEEKRRGAKQV